MRKAFKPPNTLELAFKRAIRFESIPMDHLYCPPLACHRSRQPNITVTPRPDGTKQRIIRHLNGPTRHATSSTQSPVQRNDLLVKSKAKI